MFSLENMKIGECFGFFGKMWKWEKFLLFHKYENSLGKCFPALKKVERCRGFILIMQVLMVINVFSMQQWLGGCTFVPSKGGYGFWWECPKYTRLNIFEGL